MCGRRESAYTRFMASAQQNRLERRKRTRGIARSEILGAARRVAQRDGARNLSLRGVAAEAGFAPAALYGYFRNKDELILALAADDLSRIAQAVREAARQHAQNDRFAAAASAALELLANTETLAGASTSMTRNAVDSEMERLFNGRLIAALTALSVAAGNHVRSRGAQADMVLLAAALAGLALLQRAGRLQALGFSAKEMLVRVEAHFSRVEEAA